MKISAAVITLNEANNIVECMNSLKPVCDEIVVLDSNSSDNTVEIAKKEGAKVFLQEYLGDGPQKNKCAEYCTNDWVLSIDADERLDEECYEALNNLNLDEQTGYVFKRKNFIGNYHIKASGYYPNYLVRLYNKKHFGYQENKDHAKIITAKEHKLDCHIIHYTYKDYSHWFEKIIYFSKKDAWANTHKKVGYWTPVTHAVSAMIKHLIFKGGIVSRDGWIIAFSTAIKTMFKYLIIKDLQNKEKLHQSN